MAQLSNEAILARALALNEVGGEVLEDLPGGCLARANRSWILLYDWDNLGDPEKLILQAQAVAKENSIELGGAVMIYPPGLDRGEAVEGMSEALYVYGMPQEMPGPRMMENIQVLAGNPKQKSKVEIRGGAGEMAAGAGLLQGSGFEWNTLVGGPGKLELGMADAPQCRCAYKDGEPAGAVFSVGSGLVERITGIIVRADLRGQGIGTALLSAVALSAQERGMPLVSIWCNRLDPARYFYAKAGFEDQLHCRTFLAE